jgi:N4-gp56 family major capsid protein
MSGQLWAVPAEGGYLYSPELSDVLRAAVQPATKFRQLCDAEDGSEKGLHAGDYFYWNTVSNVGTQGGRLNETTPIPETGLTMSQKSLRIYEFGNSVPYTGKLSDLGKQDVVAIIDKVLKDDARKCFDNEAFAQFKLTPLRAAAATSTSSVTLTTNSATATTNNVELGTGHVKAISDLMKERNIPAAVGDDYFAISHPTTFRPIQDQLETVRQYTESGIGIIMSGEKGRYENCRFIEQNQIPKGGANDSTTFDPTTGTADAWNNAKSSWAFFCGADRVTEAPVIMEELRAKIPGDYGRARGLAWYALTGFGIVHDDASNARIVMWDSAA